MKHKDNILIAGFCLSALFGFYVMGLAIERQSHLMVVVGGCLPFQYLLIASVIYKEI